MLQDHEIMTDEHRARRLLKERDLNNSFYPFGGVVAAVVGLSPSENRAAGARLAAGASGLLFAVSCIAAAVGFVGSDIGRDILSSVSVVKEAADSALWTGVMLVGTVSAVATGLISNFFNQEALKIERKPENLALNDAEIYNMAPMDFHYVDAVLDGRVPNQFAGTRISM